MPERAPSRTLLLALGTAAALAASLAGCDPCSGVLSCAPGPYLAVDGQTVDTVSKPVSGVIAPLLLTGQLALSARTASTWPALTCA